MLHLWHTENKKKLQMVVAPTRHSADPSTKFQKATKQKKEKKNIASDMQVCNTANTSTTKVVSARFPKRKSRNLIHANTVPLVRRTQLKNSLTSKIHSSPMLQKCHQQTCNIFLNRRVQVPQSADVCFDTSSANRNLKESEVCTDRTNAEATHEWDQRSIDWCRCRCKHERRSTSVHVVAATQVKSPRAERNPHQRESTTPTHDEPGWRCCGAVHCTCSLHNACGLHASTCFACGTLAGFLLSACQYPSGLLRMCGEVRGNKSPQEVPRTRSFRLGKRPIGEAVSARESEAIVAVEGHALDHCQVRNIQVSLSICVLGSSSSRSLLWDIDHLFNVLQLQFFAL